MFNLPHFLNAWIVFCVESNDSSKPLVVFGLLQHEQKVIIATRVDYNQPLQGNAVLYIPVTLKLK